MPSVSFVKDRTKTPWRAQVKKKGYKTRVAYFTSEDLAKNWCIEVEEDRKRPQLIDQGLEAIKQHLNRKTVGVLAEEYRKKRTHKKASHETENRMLDNFLAWENVRDRLLNDFQRQDAWDYVEYLENDYLWKGKSYVRNGIKITNKRTPKKISPATIQRHISVLSRIWKEAELKWRGYEKLHNPWLGVKPTLPIKHRTRRLRPGELVKLLTSCKGCVDKYQFYAPLAIYLAVETGMRLQEIFNLQWEDVHLERRRIHIRHTKTDYKSKTDGRWIVLTLMAYHYLRQSMSRKRYAKDGSYLGTLHNFSPKGPLFPMSKENFKQAWADIITRAGIALHHRDYRIPGTDTIVETDGEGLTFHDLRREAGSRFRRCLSVDDVACMLGHGDKKITHIYIAYDEDDPILSDIQDKLDRRVLGGFTPKELDAKNMTYMITRENEELKFKVISKKEETEKNVDQILRLYGIDPDTLEKVDEKIVIDSPSNVFKFRKASNQS